MTISCETAANHPDDPSNPRGNCYSGNNNDAEFALKLVRYAKTVAVNIAAELCRHDDMPSDDPEDYNPRVQQYLLRDIARSKDAQFSRGRRLKNDCIDKLDVAVALMGVVTDRSKTDGNTVTLETDASTNIRNRINKIISGCMTRGMSSEATTDEVWEYLKLSSEYSDTAK